MRPQFVRFFIALLYQLLLAPAFPFLLIYLAVRVARNRAYAASLGERFGLLPASMMRTEPGAVWLHAISVGEAITAVELLKRLKIALPEAPVYVSCGTLAGRAMARQKLAGLAAGVFYAPFDYRTFVRAVLRRLKPSLVIVMETEIWPNLYGEVKRSGASLMVVNGRISDRALPRYERFRAFFCAFLPRLDAVLAQDETSAARYRMLGAERVENAGNLKYDFDPETTRVAAPVLEWLDRVGPKKVWIAASTMPGEPDEDDVVLDAYEKLRDVALILVPRRPERFDEAARKMEARGIRFTRRSRIEGDAPVLLVDTIGELSGLFRVADVVFMGGTFPARGGHNILEPASFGVPVVTGPHMENFAEIAAEFRAAGAMVTVDEPGGLAAAIERVLASPGDVGVKGKKLAEARRGATARAVAKAVELYDEALVRPSGWNPLGVVWRAGMALDRAWRGRAADRPAQFVISVGNLSMGGTGKTPFVIWLCGALAARRPAVLTRGYKSGEEARLIESKTGARMGVGADRVKARRELEKSFQAGVYILDDGFQHWPMRRDLDIVLIDAVDPFRGGLVPRGRSREGFDALRRADVVVLTRTRPGREYAGLKRAILKANARVRIFAARMRARLPELDDGARVGAFCGLGHPEGFRATLAELGVAPLFFEVFDDHHRYSEAEVRALAARADVLLTTEKDLLNIDAAVAAACNVRAVEAWMEVDGGEELVGLSG